jgi:hypothetical protein
MAKKIFHLFLITILLAFITQPLIASDDDYDDNDNYEDERKERVYGWELITESELVAHREKMRSLNTMEERREYRKEHHEKMLERAKDQDVYLRDCPRPGMRGRGAGRG